MSSAPSVPGVEAGASVLVIDLCGPQVVATTRARTGKLIPAACIAQVLEASIQVVPAGRYLADALEDPAVAVRHRTCTAALTH